MRMTLLVVAAVLCSASAAAAQGDARNGRAIARSWCTGCHLVEPAGLGSDTAPPFAVIANDPARTSPRLKRWLADPHPPMPNLKLTPREIDDLVAYLESLKKKK